MVRLIFLLTTIFVLGHTTSAGAEPLGRLFFSAEERAMLEQMRQKSSSSAAAPIEQVTINGLVRRSSGKTTIWINRVPQHESENPQGISITGKATKQQAVPLLLPSGKKVEIKAGQTFDAGKGEVREGYEDGASPAPQDTAR